MTASAPPEERPAVIVLVVGDAVDATARTVSAVRETSAAEIRVVSAAEEGAEPASGRADVVVIDAGCVVAGGWLEGLAAAAYSETTVATATALTIGDLAPIEGDGALPLPELTRRIVAASPRARPRIPVCDGPCTYVRRAALDLVGNDGLLAPGRAAFSRRCLLHGLIHVAADDVAVGGSGTAIGSARVALSSAPGGSEEPLQRSLALARRALTGLSVTIDGRCLAEPLTGTQVLTVELVGALARHGGVRLRLLLPERIDRGIAPILDALPRDVERLTPKELRDDPPRSDVAHRAYQAFDADDMALLRRLGDRAVVTQQDLIAFVNGGYFSSDEDWERYRALTRAALASCDRVVFSSEYVAREAAAEALVASERAHVVAIGTDHRLVAPAHGSRPPELGAGDFVVCLGTDFVHKNRVFALRVCDELLRRHGWRGRLVFAGRRMPAASSAAAEASFLAERPRLAERTVDLGPVSEPEKAWLLENARAVLYPSVVEGFGLVPFEAARAGTPCAFAPQAALAETLPPEAALVVPWDPAATADRVARILDDEAAAKALVTAIEGAGRPLTWDESARRLVAIYEDALRCPRKRLDGISPPLVVLAEAMPRDVQEALAAVAARGWLRRPLYAALAGGRRARRLVHDVRARTSGTRSERR